MELLQFPLALALYLGGLALTALGAGRRPRPLPAFGGGMLWCAGTVSALVEGAPLDEILAAALALLLASTGFWSRGKARHEL